jgi:nucleotide-binding universal stress UspA family protein
MAEHRAPDRRAHLAPAGHGPACSGWEADPAGGGVGPQGDAWVDEKGLPHVCRTPLVNQLGGSLLLATDLSEASHSTNERAMQLAEVGRIPLRILAVMPLVSSREELDREHVESHLTTVLSLARGRGIDADGWLHVGEPAETILSVAASIGAGTIVLGDDQWRGSGNGGSIIGHVVRHAPCPVLLPRTPGA